MKVHKILTISLLTLFAFNACVEKSEESFARENFTSIFDNNQFSVSHFPIDFKETDDGGYLVLGERRLLDSNFRGVYLLKADKYGKFVSEIEMENQYVNPVGDLIRLGDAFYFFCMDGLTLQAQLVKIDADGATLTISAAGGVTYPAAASVNGNELLLLSYDHENKRTVISKHNSSGELIPASSGHHNPVGYDIGVGDDVEEPIINHFLRTGRRFPFSIGAVSNGLYYFNGFSNYTFSLVFTNFSENGPGGVVQGQQDDGGLSGVLPLGGNEFAAARFNFGDNYFIPQATLSTSAPSIAVNLGGNTLPELVSNASVRIIRAQVKSKNVLIYGSDTKSKQIGLYFYDENSGEFMSSRYLGFSNPFEIAGVIQTNDNGLAVCGTTYLAGRFPRICIIKISEAELAGQAR
jgi:hypothetical protein